MKINNKPLTRDKEIFLFKTIAHEYAILRRSKNLIDLISQENERVKKIKKAKQEIIDANLYLIDDALKKTSLNLALLTQINFDNILEDCIESFDYKKGFKFSTYAKLKIQQIISAEISKKENK